MESGVMYDLFMKSRYIDRVFFMCLQYVENTYSTFYSMVGIIAKIMFVLCMGIGAVKMALGVSDMRRVLVQTIIALFTYFVFLGIYPKLMYGMVNIVSSISRESMRYSFSLNKREKDREKFEEWLYKAGALEKDTYVGAAGAKEVDDLDKRRRAAAEKGDTEEFDRLTAIRDAMIEGMDLGEDGSYDNNWRKEDGSYDYGWDEAVIEGKNIWSSTFWGPDAGTAIKSYLNMELMIGSTGLVSLNRLIQSAFIFFQLMSNQVKAIMDKAPKDHWPHWGVVKYFFENIVQIVLMMATAVVAIIAVLYLIAEYFVSMMYFVFLFAVGVMFIPFMLWDGLSFAFKSLVSGIFKVGGRLLIAMTCVFLSMLINIDCLWHIAEVNEFSVTEVGTQGTEYYLMLVFLQVFVIFIARNISGLAMFVAPDGGEAGGVPNIGAEEVKAAMATGAGATALAAAPAVAGVMAAGKGAGMVGGFAMNVVTAAREASGVGRITEQMGGDGNAVRAAKTGAFFSSLSRGVGGQLSDAGSSIRDGISMLGGNMGKNLLAAVSGNMSGVNLLGVDKVVDGIFGDPRKKPTAEFLMNSSGDPFKRSLGATMYTMEQYSKGHIDFKDIVSQRRKNYKLAQSEYMRPSVNWDDNVANEFYKRKEAAEKDKKKGNTLTVDDIIKKLSEQEGVA